jgi:trimethylamine--corrinoid protein Co-methyltransferase
MQSVERLVRALKISRHIAPSDVLNPAEFKYMIEIGEIITGQPKSLQFVLPGHCMTPPLTLDDRAGRSLREMARLGIPDNAIATMTNLGVSAPVTLWGAVVQAAAENLAGCVAAYSIWTGYRLFLLAYTVALDMASGEATMVSPEMAWVNAAVKEFFNRRLGGPAAGTGTQYAPTAPMPGFQAVWENIYMAYAAARLEGGPVSYLGAGQLALGGVGCPEQLMLDLEAALAMRALERPVPPLNDDTLALDAMREVFPQGKTFLDHDHTLRHFREGWRPRLIRWGGSESGSEGAVLERAREMWKGYLSRYEPPGWPDDILRALDHVAQAARREILKE